jgi:hypothetical protein
MSIQVKKGATLQRLLQPAKNTKEYNQVDDIEFLSFFFYDC